MGGLYYNKKYVLKEMAPREMNAAMRVGSGADCLLFDGEDVFQERFHIIDSSKAPSGKGLDFVNHLFQGFKNSLEFMDAARDAYEKAGLTTPKFEGYMIKFEGSKLEEYYEGLIYAEGKVVLSSDEFSTVQRIVKQLKGSSHTAPELLGEGLNQFPILFEYEGVPLKMLADRIRINHKTKTIHPFDLKCVERHETFHWKWLQDHYYIQEALYTLGIEKWRDEVYPDYTVDKFKFIVADSAGFKAPLIFDLMPYQGDLLNGFETRSGKKYEGLKDILFEVGWAEQNGVWDMTFENYNNNGVIKQIM